MVILIRAADVPTYVQYGAADLGVAGKDVLMEHGGEGLYEPLDLGIARCRLMVAGKPGAATSGEGRMRIATKYVETARAAISPRKACKSRSSSCTARWSWRRWSGWPTCIVDVVDTGNTLKRQRSGALEHIADISSRLIVNKAAMKMKHAQLQRIYRTDARRRAGNDVLTVMDAKVH